MSKDWTIRRLLLALASLGVVVAVLVGSSGLYQQARGEATEATLLRNATAVRQVMDADMMHDALRADVLRSLFLAQKGTRAEREEVRKDTIEHVARFRAALDHESVRGSSEEVQKELAAMKPALESYLNAATEITALAARDPEAAERQLPDFQKAFEALEEEMGKLDELAEAQSTVEVAAAAASHSRARYVTLVFIAIGAGASLLLGRLIAKSILGDVETIRRVTAQVGAGNFREHAEIRSQNELGQTANALNQVIDGLRLTLEAEQVDWAEVGKTRAEVGRIRQLVDNAPLAILYLDRDLVVQLANPAATRGFQALEGALPYRADQWVGRSFRQFYNDSNKPRDFLADARNLPYRGMFELGTDTLELVACAIVDARGEQLGTMVTWEVVTERVTAERKVREAQEEALQSAEDRRRHEAEIAGERQREAAVRQGEERARAEAEAARGAELRAKVDSILEVVDRAARGDLTAEIEVSGEDAIGRLGVGLSRFFATLRGSLENVARTSETVSSASLQVSRIGSQMGSTASETARQASTAARTADDVSRNLSTIAAATLQMSASVSEISSNATNAVSVARRAVSLADQTNGTVSKLGESSTAISNVTKLINSIAQQTNLLALNATIEAARAGEMGKGFAVVAHEVKELAKETARATEEIGRQVEAIQGDTNQTVEAIRVISEIIGEISNTQAAIAAAVEEQKATTSEMSRNVNQAADGARDIASAVGEVATAAGRTEGGAADSQAASTDLGQAADVLRELVRQFKFTPDRPGMDLRAPFRPEVMMVGNA
ncbi:MAG: HAMP domain-containing protein [Myxococcales bacterium]|nr:HAMP domain-containing protein [Myxococcales bacterium]